MLQTSGNTLAAIARETVFGVPAVADASHQLRITDSPGLELDRAQINSNERRRDGLKGMGRLGSNSTGGGYNCEVTVGGATDLLAEAIMRTNWSAPVTTTVDGGAALTSFSVTNQNEINLLGTGSFLTLGYKVGDVVRLSNMSTAVNNGINLRIVSVTAAKITVAGTPLTNQAADAAATLTRLKKLTNPAVRVRHSHTIEQVDVDIDASEVFLGCRLISAAFSFRPGQPATVVWTFMGHGDTEIFTAGDSPWFDSPVVTTGDALIADDAAIRFNGEDVATFTGFDLTLQIASQAPAVIGSNNSPDVFDNEMTVTATVTGLRSGFANVERYRAETEFQLSFLLAHPITGECFSIFLPRVKIGKLSAPFGGGDGPKIETLTLMVGPNDAPGADEDNGALTMLSSAVMEAEIFA